MEKNNFTNGSKDHAVNVTKRIGIDKLFDGIFDIRDCEFIPKPSKNLTKIGRKLQN